jgi:hypothetical protein
MSKIDWSKLGAIPKGLAVEGEDDKIAIAAFLDAGEKGGYWSNWRFQLGVFDAGNSSKVLNELKAGDNRIWGLIDRDWRNDAEIVSMQKDYPQLLVLPRVTIENYLIDSDELHNLLPPVKRIPVLRQNIERYRDDWVRNGALWQVLHDNGAHEFCRGDESGYPKALRYTTLETDIEAQFQQWYEQLNPTTVMSAYRIQIQQFQVDTANHYTRHIHGKHFFNQIVVSRVLNPNLGQQAEDKWFSDLFSGVSDCPSDLIPVLQQIVS